MATAKKKQRKKTTKSTRSKKTTVQRRRNHSAKQNNYRLNITGLIFALIAILAIFRWGFLGNLFANCFRLFVGDTYIVAATIFGMLGLYLLTIGHWPHDLPFKRLAGMFLVYLSTLLLNTEIFFAHLDVHRQFTQILWASLKADFRRGKVTETVAGGMIGGYLYRATYFLLSNWGTILIAILSLIIGILMFTMIPFHDITQAIQTLFKKTSGLLHSLGHKAKTFQASFFEDQEDQEDQDDVADNDTPSTASTDDDVFSVSGAQSNHKSQSSIDNVMRDQKLAATAQPVSAATKSNATTHEPKETAEGLPKPHDGFDVHFSPTGAAVTEATTGNQQSVTTKNTTKAPVVKKIDPQTGEILAADPQLIPEHDDYSNYQLPTSDLLSMIPPTDQSSEVALIQKNRATLEQTFKSFGVDVKVIHADLGPTVTKYEVKPGLGVKVNKIVNLADDLALALAAKDIRIEAPIPGKPYVGIEVPNRTIATVSFREVIEKQPMHPGKILEVPLGKSVTGEVITANLTKMPHLLIAGSTGSGKSVMINVIITSILMRARPDEVKLMLIDPKMVELSVYNDIPHLLLPVVTNPKKAANALNKAVSEMEDRYQRFEAAGVRDIDEYNNLVRENNADKTKPVMEEMPFMVIVIDELADLMMAAGNEVETAIVRLAQKARAAGVHLIIATQRPSVDVITGLIKANIPSRIAFAVSSGIDSRTILDANGAEKLLGRGDMMFSPVGLSKPIRIQGAYISGRDVQKIIDFVKDQQTANYDQDLIAHVNDVTEDDHQQEHDEHFQEAVEYVIQEKKASTSMIQRRFRIGYNRAALIIDDMEQVGVVGASEGSKGRKVLWGTANYQQYFGLSNPETPSSNEYLS
ncbi:DNA translocase FtsK [Lapidilactobacillus bayanensis]|uniref:DNA translocase FtsK n=1 Tax=Lapidilactobacillus bayanensis TaxID=2485998 RepID=UPI000F7AE026|nr:DNA translocase FtsK [Lapidilactobacillus bayanensis]